MGQVRETDDCRELKSLTSRILVPRILALKTSKITAASTRGSEGTRKKEGALQEGKGDHLGDTQAGIENRER